MYDKKTKWSDKWYIATNGKVWHCGFCKKGQQLTTGMPKVTTFTDENKFLTKVKEIETEQGIKIYNDLKQ